MIFNARDRVTIKNALDAGARQLRLVYITDNIVSELEADPTTLNKVAIQSCYNRLFQKYLDTIACIITDSDYTRLSDKSDCVAPSIAINACFTKLWWQHFDTIATIVTDSDDTLLRVQSTRTIACLAVVSECAVVRF